jgi:hypothetical protein
MLGRGGADTRLRYAAMGEKKEKGKGGGGRVGRLGTSGS